MSKPNSDLFSNTKGAVLEKVEQEILSNTSIVWNYIKSTQENYIGTNLPRLFEIETNQGKMWTHGNATKHMYEYITSIKQYKSPIIDSNPNILIQYVLYDYHIL